MRIDLRSDHLIHNLFKAETGHNAFPEISGIATDSRECHPGDLYSALSGERVNGHDFIGQAQSNGAVAALVSKKNYDVQEIFQAKVDNPLRTVGAVAKRWRSNFNFPLIGITGSNGKTSTKDLLSHVLETEYSVHSTIGNHNTTISLPLTLLSMAANNNISVLEMGASAPGEIEYLSTIAIPTHGLITNIAPAHLEGFGSLASIIKEKCALYSSLDKGVSFINMDDDNLRNVSVPGRKVTFGSKGKCDHRYTIEMSDLGYLIRFEDNLIETGSANMSFVKNCMAVTTIALELGVDLKNIQEGIRTSHPSKGRCEIKEFEQFTVIDDTYNANLQSVKSAIDYLANYPGKYRRIFIFGDMKELGSETYSHHMAVGTYALESGLDGMITVGIDTISTSKAASGLKMNKHFEKLSDLNDDLKKLINPGDLILVKGSRSMKMENVFTMLENI